MIKTEVLEHYNNLSNTDLFKSEKKTIISSNIENKSKSLIKTELEISEFIDKLNDTQFSYFITLPLKQRNLSYDLISRKNEEFIIRLNRKIFTPKELKNNATLKVLPVIEKDNHIHLLIDNPPCKRLNEQEDEYDFIFNKIKSIVSNMKLCDLSILKMRKVKKLKYNKVDYKIPLIERKSFQIMKTAKDKTKVISYITKQNKLKENIDYLNIKLTR